MNVKRLQTKWKCPICDEPTNKVLSDVRKNIKNILMFRYLLATFLKLFLFLSFIKSCVSKRWKHLRIIFAISFKLFFVCFLVLCGNNRVVLKQQQSCWRKGKKAQMLGNVFLGILLFFFRFSCWFVQRKKENWLPQKLSYSMSRVFISQKLKIPERTTSLHMYLVQAGDSTASGLLVDSFKYICKAIVLLLSGFLLFFFAFLAFFCDWGLYGLIESSNVWTYKATSRKILKMFHYGFNIASFSTSICVLSLFLGNLFSFGIASTIDSTQQSISTSFFLG